MINTESESRREWLLHMFRYHARFNSNNRYFQVWQQDNHPLLLYSQSIIWQKVNYIHMNPVRARIVETPADYLYSSARNYERENRDCLMEIDLLEPFCQRGEELNSSRYETCNILGSSQRLKQAMG
jgi:hypothetical protein